MATAPAFPETIPPTPADARLAQEAASRLGELLTARKKPLSLTLQPEGEPAEAVVLPPAAWRLLAAMLAEMAKGNAVALVPVDAELTTRQAAELPKVSRPFLIEQLEKGAIPFRRVGKHRRVRVEDLLAYKRERDRFRPRTLGELIAEAQELGMGY
jgi:excisionase family DNA binding protein